jgi:dienelactone hydrolase
LTTRRALPPLCARISAVLIFTALLVACGSGAKPPALHLAGSPRLHFAYDAALPLQYVDHGRVAGHPGPIAVHDVSFRSDGATIDGYLVLPPGRGRRPAVVVVHGSGGDRRELLTEAEWLAARNVVVLTITEPSTSNPPAPASTGPAAILGQLRDTQVRDVIAIRRAVDALRSLRVVDPRRIGYLGWSAGAKTGAFVAASEPRVKALVLLSAGADPVSAFVAHAPPALRAVVRRDLGSVDPIRYIAAARPGSVLLEDGTRDEIVPHAALLNVINAAPKGTTVRWYAAPHALNRAAYHDAFDWLARKLPIDGPRVSGAATESTRGG